MKQKSKKQWETQATHWFQKMGHGYGYSLALANEAASLFYCSNNNYVEPKLAAQQLERHYTYNTPLTIPESKPRKSCIKMCFLYKCRDLKGGVVYVCFPLTFKQ